MRVVYAIDSLAQGGAERSVVSSVPALVARGVEVAVLVQRPGGALTADARAAGATVVPLDVDGRAAAIDATRGFLASAQPDLVHTALFESSIAGRLAAARLGLPVVTTLTGTPYGEDHRAGPGARAAKVRAAQLLDVATARLAWRFHAPAQHVADTMARRLAVPPDRIDVIPRGRDAADLDTDPARGLALRSELGIGPEVPVVLALARHEHVKGIDQLVRAAADLHRALPAARVLVAGREGGATDELRRAASQLPDGLVQLLGHRDDVGTLLGAADVLVVPSRREGLPGVIIEAMLLGVPVVATDVPGVRDALGPDLGVVVPGEDPAALAGALVRVVRDPSCAGTPSAARARAAARFSVDGVAEQTVALWRRTMAAGPPGVVARAARAAARPPAPAST